MPKIHGIELAKNSVIKNAVIETLTSDPVIEAAGRVWFNSTTKTYKMSMLDVDGSTLVVRSFSTAEAVSAALTTLNNDLSSTVAGKGSGLVGFVGAAGSNGEFSVAAGTTEAAITAIVQGLDDNIVADEALDDRITELESKVGGNMGDLATLTTDAKDTIVAAINEVDAHIDAEVLARETAVSDEQTRAETAESDLQDQIDVATADLADNYVNKTTSTAQTVTPDMIFNGTVRFNGDILQEGASKIVMGEEVLFEDNIVFLNSNQDAETAPTEDAGWGVNRGTMGNLVVVKWDETEDIIKGVKSVDAEGVPTYDTFAFDSEVAAIEEALDARLDDLESKVGGNMGDLATLTTDAKDTIVAAINEVDANADAYIEAVAANTGATLVGYAGKTGANGLAVVTAGTVTQSLDTIVTFADAEAKAADDRIADEGSTTAGKGAGLIGFVGKAGLNSNFTVTSGSTEAALVSIVSAIDADRQAEIDQVSDLASTVAGKGSGLVGFSGQTGDNGKFSVAAGTTENAVKSLVSEMDAVKHALDSDSGAINERIDNLVVAVNATKYKTVSSSATSHTITHNLGSQEVAVATWVKDGSSWKNHIVGITIVDANTVQVDLTEAYEVKVLVEKFDDVTA